MSLEVLTVAPPFVGLEFEAATHFILRRFPAGGDRKVVKIGRSAGCRAAICRAKFPISNRVLPRSRPTKHVRSVCMVNSGSRFADFWFARRLEGRSARTETNFSTTLKGTT